MKLLTLIAVVGLSAAPAVAQDISEVLGGASDHDTAHKQIRSGIRDWNDCISGLTSRAVPTVTQAERDRIGVELKGCDTKFQDMFNILAWHKHEYEVKRITDDNALMETMQKQRALETFVAYHEPTAAEIEQARIDAILKANRIEVQKQQQLENHYGFYQDYYDAAEKYIRRARVQVTKEGLEEQLQMIKYQIKDAEFASFNEEQGIQRERITTAYRELQGRYVDFDTPKVQAEITAIKNDKLDRMARAKGKEQQLAKAKRTAKIEAEKASRIASRLARIEAKNAANVSSYTRQIKRIEDRAEKAKTNLNYAAILNIYLDDIDREYPTAPTPELQARRDRIVKSPE